MDAITEKLFYRYDSIQYATLGADGDYISRSFPNPSLILHTYHFLKETPKGYWIGYNNFIQDKLKQSAHWVSKTSIKKFAYPTKKEALESFIKRNEKRAKILSYQLETCKINISKAKQLKL